MLTATLGLLRIGDSKLGLPAALALIDKPDVFNLNETCFINLLWQCLSFNMDTGDDITILLY